MKEQYKQPLAIVLQLDSMDVLTLSVEGSSDRPNEVWNFSDFIFYSS